MLSSSVLVALAAFTSLVSAASNGTAICRASIYPSLGCLTHHPAAATLCKKVPAQTSTLTVTTTTIAVHSTTITQHAQSQVTVNETSTQWTSKTLTTGPCKTITAIYTDILTKNTTIATYVPTAVPAGEPFPPLCRPPHAVSALGSLANGTLATACSCLGHPVSTTTSTIYVNAPAVKATTTAVQGTAPTTTIYQIVLATTTIFVHPEETVSARTTSCTTSTYTETYAAPTFTPVFGPKAGCQDVAAGEPKHLDGSVTKLGDATQQCRSLCEQDSTCEFVYVQKLFSKDGGKPYFGCTFNEKHLDAGKDLKCGGKAGVYGVAMGFDAYGRGTQPLSV